LKKQYGKSVRMSEQTIWEEFEEENFGGNLKDIAKEAVEFFLKFLPSLAGAREAQAEDLASEVDVEDLAYDMLKVAAQWMDRHGINGSFVTAQLKAAKRAGEKVRSREDMFGHVPEEFSGWLCEAYEEGRERARYNAPDDGDTDDDG